ncbi:Core-2/I-branching beta-1 [Forsythia ovata]|uniref:Core-2/I-branching beta-1 n=1 Tax=Forsythia ovata TaxID=205694 RepID=A0ABD1RME6_9LAMI
MLSPTPVSLLCALLLCLPLAIVFTLTTPSTPSSTTTTVPIGGAATSPFPTTTSVTSSKNITIRKPLPRFPRKTKTPQKRKIKNTTTEATTISPPPPPGKPPLPPAPPSGQPPLHVDNIEGDDDDDYSLFQLASRVNPNPKKPIKKIAFMFLTNTPLPFAPLWELFFNNTPKKLYNIYVHADPNFNYTPPFRGVFRHRVIHSKPTRRHSPTLISAARRLLAHALLDDKSNYMFALLSPACIPLHSFNFTYRTLIKSKKSFIEILKNEAGAYDRWAARGESVMIPEVRFENFRIGSQFWVIKRKHARISVRDRRLWSKFKLPCLEAATCYPEEHYFPTLLNMVDSRGIIPCTLTHVDWKGSYGGHPRMYKPNEVCPELIRALRKHTPRNGDDESNGLNSSLIKRHDPFLFARKFAPGSVQPLMSIANDVIFKD